MNASPLPWLLQEPIHHHGYIVEDIPTAVEHWAAQGVGPFFHLDRVALDRATHRGKEAYYFHSAAIAKFGDRFVEFHQIFDATPEPVAHGLGVGLGQGD